MLVSKASVRADGDGRAVVAWRDEAGTRSAPSDTSSVEVKTIRPLGLINTENSTALPRVWERNGGKPLDATRSEA